MNGVTDTHLCDQLSVSVPQAGLTNAIAPSCENISGNVKSFSPASRINKCDRTTVAVGMASKLEFQSRKQD
jgi:hypothetical protein